MPLLTLLFFAHQPERLRPWNQRDGSAQTSLHDYYFDGPVNKQVFEKVAQKCYWPATTRLRDALLRHKDSERPFKFAFALSGTLLDQIRRYDPPLLKVFQEVAATGNCEFTGETYFHSLSGLFDERKEEFAEQTKIHANAIEELFGRRPTFFRNTECLYNNGVAQKVKELGYTGILTEGIERILDGWRSPDYVYQSTTGLPVLLRNYQLADDWGYRFSNKGWDGWPLTAEKFAGWIAQVANPCVTLALDYEALGEHHWEDTGILDFLASLPEEIARHPQIEWATPTETVQRVPSAGTIDVNDYSTVSWADAERDTSAWLVNEMQQVCFEEMKRLEPLIKATDDAAMLDSWRRMLTSDHLYYICDKNLSDGDVHGYFSAYGSIAEAFVHLHTALMDLRQRALRTLEKQGKVDGDSLFPQFTPARKSVRE